MTAHAQELIKSFVNSPCQTIRICAKDAKELLLANHTIIVAGNVRYLQMVPIGEGVYSVKLLPIGWDKEFGTICLDPKTPWLVTEKTLNLKKRH